jgi:hypothetical protein
MPPADFRSPRVGDLFAFPATAAVAQVWKPLALAPNDFLRGYNFASIGRLAPGVAGTGEGRARRVAAHPAAGRSGSTADGRRAGAAIAAVLMIACVNIANLTLAQASSRDREVVVRRAIGATRARVMRQFLTEGAVVAGIGGLSGLALAGMAMRLLVVLAPADLPRLDEVQLDARGLLFIAGLTAACALMIGLTSAWRMTRVSASRWCGQEQGAQRMAAAERAPRNPD